MSDELKKLQQQQKTAQNVHNHIHQCTQIIACFYCLCMVSTHKRLDYWVKRVSLIYTVIPKISIDLYISLEGGHVSNCRIFISYRFEMWFFLPVILPI